MGESIRGTVTPKAAIRGELDMAEMVYGTRNYKNLNNKPSIEGVELIDDKSLIDLGLQGYLDDYLPKSDVDSEISDTSENPVQNKAIYSALDEKVDKEPGKGLSTNDYDDNDKTKLDSMVDIKSIGVGLNFNETTGELTASGFDVPIDSEMSTTSTNPVQNKVITAALEEKVNVHGTDSLMTEEEHTKLSGIESGANVNVQADWDESDSESDSFINNKPTLGTASTLDVAVSGDASTSEVVKGDDTRLTDARNAADVYPWAKAENKPTYTANEVGAIASTEKGTNGGVAELDANGKVPSAQLPSYVDDVLEYANLSAFPVTGETGKIYVALDTNETYRWSGTVYVEISEGLALGETSSTAYAGNKGKANADAITAIKDGTNIDSFADVETALSGKQDTLTFDNTPTANSDNPVKSQGIKTAIDASQTAQTSLLHDTVGWTGKNLLKNTATTQTVRGVTFTVNADGSVTANGTATGGNASLSNWSIPLTLTAGKYILSGCPSGGSATTYALLIQDEPYTESIFEYGDGAVIDISETKTFHPYFGFVKEGVTVNNLTFYPMIRRADIIDDTYEPYYIPLKQSKFDRAEQAVLGAKNLIPYPYENGSSRTNNGTTFTVDEDGVVSATRSESGNRSYYEVIWYTGSNAFPFNDVPVILSGCPRGGGNDTYRMDIVERNNNARALQDYGDGVLIPAGHFADNADRIQIRISIAASYMASNLKFKPMLRLASDPDDTYVPYAMTNKELTEKTNELANNVNIINSALNIGSISANDDLNDYYATGEYNADTAAIASTIINKPSDLTVAFQLRVINRGKTKDESLQIRTVTQIIECINENNSDVIYKRTKTHNAQSWGSWYKFTGTVVS